MTAYADTSWSSDVSRLTPRQASLWTVAAATMLAVHVAAAWWATRLDPEPAAEPAAQTAIMIDLAPVAESPPAVEEQQALDTVDSLAAVAPDTVEPLEAADAGSPVAESEEALPAPAETEPLPEEPLEAEPPLAQEPLAEAEPEELAPVEETAEPVEEIDPVDRQIELALENVEVPLPVARPQPPKPAPEREARPRREVRKAERPEPKREVRRAERERAAPAPQRSQARATEARNANRAAASAASAGRSASVSPARWASRLRAHLERRKRYPNEARRERQQGTASVRFSVDANGNVGSVALNRSSGYPQLDQEAVSMVRRASPVPAPPPGVNRTIVVPVNFSLR